MIDTLTLVPEFDGPEWTIYRDEHHFVAQVADKDDARLFAAAPQLLEACEELATLYAEAIGEELGEHNECECIGCDALGRARAAIRAAREG